MKPFLTSPPYPGNASSKNGKKSSKIAPGVASCLLILAIGIFLGGMIAHQHSNPPGPLELNPPTQAQLEMPAKDGAMGWVLGLDLTRHHARK